MSPPDPSANRDIPGPDLLRRLDPVLLLILGIGALFLFLNLGNRQLWTDEAETACLAKNILRFGVPQAFDGVNYISQWVIAKREDFNEDLIWILSPWLQLYVAAGSLKLFGLSTFAARLPFALLGLVNLVLLYRLAWAYFQDRRIARVASGLLLFCVPFLLHMRQCRYYSLAILFTLVILLAYHRILTGTGRGRRVRDHLQLVLGLAFLFHTNYGLCLPVLGSLGIHALFFAWRRVPFLWVGLDVIGVVALTAPYAAYASISRTGSRFLLSYFPFNLVNYAICINHYLLPLVLPLAVVILARLLGVKKGPSLSVKHPGLSLIVILTVTDLLFVSTNIDFFFRYIITLVPLLILVQAVCLVRIVDIATERFGLRGRLAWLLIPISVTTTVLSQPIFPLLYAVEKNTDRHHIPDMVGLRRPRADYFALDSEFDDFLYEITHDFDGPNEGILDFLGRHADRNDLIFTEYGDLPLMFSTDFTIRGGHQGIPYIGEPDFLVVRAYRSPRMMRQFAKARGYTEHRLEVPDTNWENRPDPYAHQFRTAPIIDGPIATEEGYPAVVIYSHPRKGLGSPGTEGQNPRPSPDTLTLPTPAPRTYRRTDGPTNLLLVTVDSLRSDRVFSWHDHFETPPEYARLADESFSAPSYRTVAPGTATSVASLLTGRYPRDLGFPGVDRSLPRGVPNLASILERAGYRTGAVVSNLTLDPEIGLHAGFRDYLGPPEGISRRQDFATTREARHWLLARDSEQPWFLWVHLNGAHGPYRACLNPFLAFLHPLNKMKPSDQDAQETPRFAPTNAGVGGIPPYQQLPAEVDRVAEYIRYHDVGTLIGDAFFRELRLTLRAMKVDHRTVIAVVGTHGEHLGSAGIYFTHGDDLSPASLETPLILHVPGREKQTLADPASTVDLLPTLLGLLPPSSPPDLPGTDLLTDDLAGRIGTWSETQSPLSSRRQTAVTGPEWQVFQLEDESPRARRWSRDLDATSEIASESTTAEIRQLLQALVSIRDASSTPPGPRIRLDRSRKSALVDLGYVRSRFPKDD